MCRETSMESDVYRYMRWPVCWGNSTLCFSISNREKGSKSTNLWDRNTIYTTDSFSTPLSPSADIHLLELTSRTRHSFYKSRLSAEAPTVSTWKVYCIMYEYVNRWLTLLLWETDQNKHPVCNCLKRILLCQVVNNSRSFGGVCCSNLQGRSNTKLQGFFETSANI